MSVAARYSSIYQNFNSALQQKIRAEAYSEDIGQHSWITATELRSYSSFLNLNNRDLFLDFGCGPGGPLCFLVQATLASAIGVDISEPALAVAIQRATLLNLVDNINLFKHDVNEKLSFTENKFDCVISFDVILHLQNRSAIFEEWKRVLKPGGRILFTDAGVLSGPVSNDELQLRSINGYTQFVPAGLNIELLKEQGFELQDKIDQSIGPIENATGRYRARKRYKKELLEEEGHERFEQEQKYLECVVELYQRKALCRYAYLLHYNES